MKPSWFRLRERPASDATAALRLSEERYRELVETIRHGILEITNEGQITFANPAFHKMIGYDQGKVVGHFIFEFMPDEPRRREVKAYIANLVANHPPPTPRVTRYQTKTGQLIDVQVDWTYKLDEQGKTVGFISVVTNITERLRTEEELRRTREQLERRVAEQSAALEESRWTLTTLMSSLPGMAYRCRNDKHWTMKIVSEGCFELTGFQPSDLLHNKTVAYADLIFPEDRDKVWEQVQAAIDHRQPFRVVYRIKTASGKEKWVWEQGRGVFSLTNKLVALEGFITDITERKAYERQIERQEAFLRQVIDISPNMIFTKDWDGKFTLVNKTVANVYGTTVEHLLGKTDADFNSNLDEVESFRRVDRHVIETGEEVFTAEEILTDAKGNQHVVQTVKRPLIGENGKTEVLGVASDITARKRAEEESRRHQEELARVGRISTMGEMASGLAHELNQPLSAIVSYTQTCVKALQATNRQDNSLLFDVLGKIAEQGQRAGEIIRRMREFVRHHKPRREEVNINAVIRDALTLIEPEAREKRVVIHLNLADPSPILRGDNIQIEQVLINLMKNAVEAMEAVPENSRRMEVGTVQVGDERVIITVSDTGPGLAPEATDRAFDPFFTTKGHGIGMGLSISRSIVEAHGGRIQATRNPESGMLFTVMFPVTADDQDYGE